MPLSLCKKLKLNLEECKLKTETFGGFIVKSVCKVVVIVENGSDKIKTEFVVVDTNPKSILGLNGSIKLNFVMKDIDIVDIVDIVVDRGKDNFINTNIDIFSQKLGNFQIKL